jgi:hypothetical protein
MPVTVRVLVMTARPLFFRISAMVTTVEIAADTEHQLKHSTKVYGHDHLHKITYG